MSEYIQQQLNNLSSTIKDDIINFILYVLRCIGTFVVDTSDIFCPIVCLIALAFYIGGQKKAGKVVSGSFIFYFILQALRRFIVLA